MAGGGATVPRELAQQGARGVHALVHAQEVIVVLEPESPMGVMTVVVVLGVAAPWCGMSAMREWLWLLRL